MRCPDRDGGFGLRRGSATIAVPVGAVFGGTVKPVSAGGSGRGRRSEYRSGGPTSDGHPVHPHVGDVVPVDVVIENKAEGSQTTTLICWANGKVVGVGALPWGWSPESRLDRLSFALDRPGRPPPASTGIGVEAYVRRIRPPSITGWT